MMARNRRKLAPATPPSLRTDDHAADRVAASVKMRGCTSPAIHQPLM